MEATFDPIKAIQAVVSQRTEQEREEWEKYQAEERAKLGTMNVNALLGARQIEIALSELKNGDSDFEYTRLAEGYSLMGDFEKAFELTRDATKKTEYKEILDATNLDCTCPSQNKFITDSYPGFTLWRCGKCRHLRKC